MRPTIGLRSWAAGRWPLAVGRWRSTRLARAGVVLRAMLGVPDYERYRAHLAAAHPGAEPLTRDEFARMRLAERYSKPGARCC